uniref:CRM domain-containing protein n=1 Tax=Aegilops tauschii subsp. strangulata TaxID=200361 RepID=A0A453CAH2_AEGTS
HFVSPLCFAFLRPTLARRRPRSSPQDSRTLSQCPLAESPFTTPVSIPAQRISYRAHHAGSPPESARAPPQRPRTIHPSTRARGRTGSLELSPYGATGVHGRSAPLAPAGHKDVAPPAFTTSAPLPLVRQRRRDGAFPRNNEAQRTTSAARKKEERLLAALKKIEPNDPSEPTHDPEVLTPEEHFYFLKMGQKSKNYVPVGRRGIYQGVILNMHLHWKKHQTLQVIVKTFTPEEVKEIASELAVLSGGIVLSIEEGNTIIMYRGKNYAQPPPEIMSPKVALPRKKVCSISAIMVKISMYVQCMNCEARL